MKKPRVGKRRSLEAQLPHVSESLQRQDRPNVASSLRASILALSTLRLLLAFNLAAEVGGFDALSLNQMRLV